jgi:amino acid transporter
VFIVLIITCIFSAVFTLLCAFIHQIQNRIEKKTKKTFIDIRTTKALINAALFREYHSLRLTFAMHHVHRLLTDNRDMERLEKEALRAAAAEKIERGSTSKWTFRNVLSGFLFAFLDIDDNALYSSHEHNKHARFETFTSILFPQRLLILLGACGVVLFFVAVGIIYVTWIM